MGDCAAKGAVGLEDTDKHELTRESGAPTRQVECESNAYTRELNRTQFHGNNVEGCMRWPSEIVYGKREGETRTCAATECCNASSADFSMRSVCRLRDGRSRCAVLRAHAHGRQVKRVRCVYEKDKRENATLID